MDINRIKRMDVHAHSEYSNLRLIDSINKPKDLILTAYKLGLSGVTLTDHETVSGHVVFLDAEKELKEKEIIPKDFKCACGNEIYLVNDRNNIERYWHFILIAKNTEGHKALRELSSIAWYNGFSSRGQFRVPTQKNELTEIVKKYPNSLIATSSCLGGELPNLVNKLIDAENKCADNIYELKQNIVDFINYCKNLFNEDFYIEIAAATSKDQIRYNSRVIEIAKALNIKIVIGSDAHYLTSKEREIHKAYLNSKDGDREVDEFYYFAHLMDNNEAYEYLSNLITKDEFINICNNSMEIYNKIETYNIFRNPIIPEVQVKDYSKINYEMPGNQIVLKKLFNSDNIQERYWVNECVNALRNKNLYNIEYLDRLETEAKVIKIIGEKLGDCLFKYFNTFQHFIDLFWDCGSIVGPGRGSAVCFLSNYLLNITQLDPIKWGLKHWRFLNEERIELPKL